MKEGVRRMGEVGEKLESHPHRAEFVRCMVIWEWTA